MYQVAEVSANISANDAQLAVWGSISMFLAYVQMFYGAWVGFRDRSYAIPIAANTMFFAHDSYYTYLHDYWFHTIQTPFVMNGWYQMALYLIPELIIAWQIITYGRREAGLGTTWLQGFVSYVAIQIGVYILFLWFREMTGDPLYIDCFAVSVVFSNLFNIPMLLRRGSRKGQSLIIAGALLIQTGPIAFFMVWPAMGDMFRTPLWMVVGAANTILAAVYFYMLWKAPAYKRDTLHADEVPA